MIGETWEKLKCSAETRAQAVDNSWRFWWGGRVNFLPVLRPVVLMAAAVSLAACETPANRRELYNTSEPNGVWHDYERRQEAEAEVGLPAGSTSTSPGTASAPLTTRGSRPTAQPRSGPLQADPTSLPSTNSPAPGPTTTTTVNPAAALVPAQPGEAAPASSSSEPVAPPQ